MKNQFGATAERAYMLAGVMAALSAVLRELPPGRREGGELQTYEDAMQAAVDASDALDERIDCDAIEGCFCYEVHDQNAAVQKLYREIALLAATDQVTDEGTIGAVTAFLAEREDLPTLLQQEAGEPEGQSGPIQVSLDGGETYQPARLGVRVIHPVLIDDNERGELHVNHTTEGLIADLWVGDVHHGTRAELASDVVDALQCVKAQAQTEETEGAPVRLYELQLAGYDGATDETDDRILWVSAKVSPEELSQMLRDAALLGGSTSGISQVVELLSRHRADFDLPRDLPALERRIVTLTGQPA